MSAFAAELAAIDAEEFTSDAAGVARRAFRAYHRAALTGSFAALAMAAGAVAEATAALGPAEDLCLLQANIALKYHRVHDVPPLLGGLRGRPEAQALLGDALWQMGRSDEAVALYQSAAAAESTWANLARLAHIEPDDDKADALYARAQEDLTAKEMRAFAWLDVQRGQRRPSQARYHFERADRAYSGWWQVEVKLAELHQDVERFRALVARCDRPELMEGLGHALAASGRHDEAAVWRGRALAAYRQSAERGEVHYLHHLAELDEPEAALRWAEQDYALRPHARTAAVLDRARARAAAQPSRLTARRP